MTGSRALLVGDVIDDIIVVPTGPIRPDTDTASRIARLPGGSAANTAAWLGWLGAGVDFVGRVGVGDGERHTRELADAGVDAHLGEDAVRATGTIVILVEGQRRTMLTDRGANAALDPAQVTDALLATAGILHLTGYSLVDALPARVVRELVERAHAHGASVSLDPSSTGFIADHGVEAFRRAIAGVDVLRPNLDEGRLLAGLDAGAPPALVAEALLDLAPAVVLTCGAAGVTIAELRAGESASVVSLDAERVATVDPTGAGDSFTAGFLAARLAGADLTRAAREGQRAAAIAVSRVGGRPPAG
ncbi:PfkB family carbohydrate kinase [Microcella alkalica]|uniref:Sugar/nucleoside kinase (Ribokinase family) n=1 Tax=Microcella alkalica TaxID=355930 RepID=A0A839EAR7_9MICO|nr:PfkB family carbohydrate kinase [Microcella alkalica]MBA8848820.1 sugar/nucleoside kinase (ribokinase family) [Microcella alkalica]